MIESCNIERLCDICVHKGLCKFEDELDGLVSANVDLTSASSEIFKVEIKCSRHIKTGGGIR